MNNAQSESQRKLKLVAQHVNRHIETFQNSARYYRKTYFLTSLSTIMLSAVITVAAGWKGSLFGWKSLIDRNDLILLIGPASTVLSAWGLFYSPNKSWLIFQESANRLRSLRSTIELLEVSPAKIDDTSVDKVYVEYQAIMDAQNKAWLDLREAASALADNVKKQAGDVRAGHA